MRTQTLTVYKFNELPTEIQDKIIQKNCDINTDYNGWDDFVIEEHTEKLELIGFDDVKIRYSGFYSQGDGASFYSKTLDLFKIMQYFGMDKTYPTLWKYLNEDSYNVGGEVGMIELGSMYSHENSVKIDGYLYLTNDEQDSIDAKQFEKESNELVEWLENWRYEYSKDIYRDLKNEYEMLCSREQIIETLEINEFEFYSDGTIARTK